MHRCRSVFIALSTVLLLASAARSDELYVLDNRPSVGTCNGIPFHGMAGGTEVRYQLWIAASHLPGKVCTLTRVAFAPCNSVTFTATAFQMRMSHTTLFQPSRSFAANLTAPVSVIPTGPITWKRTANQWCPLHFVQPFVYDGMSHLVLEIRFRQASSAASSDHVAGHTVPGYYRIYVLGTGSYSQAPNGLVDIFHPLKIRLTYLHQHVLGSGNPSIGRTIFLKLSMPGDSSLPYQVGTSFGTGPLPIGNRKLDLSLDPLLVLTVTNRLPTVFRNYAGCLDAGGKASASVAIPNLPGLIGTRLHNAFVTIKAGAPCNIHSVSTTLMFTIAR